MARERRYAEETTVTIASSQTEARRLLTRYGADTIRLTEDAERTMLEFRLHGWVIRFMVAAPALSEEVVVCTRAGAWRPESQRKAAQQQEYRRRFRSLVLQLKAKLEAVSSGDVLTEAAFMPELVTHENQTVAEWLLPQLDALRRSGRTPELMPAASTMALPPMREVER
jgi:hypothetical protein